MPFLPTAAYSIHLQVALDNVPNTLGRLATAIGEAGANIMSMGGFDVRGDLLVNDVVVNCRDEDHASAVVSAIKDQDGVEILHWHDRTFDMHQGGKIEVVSLAEVNDRHDLSMAYTPGVARVCMAIHEDPARAYDLTIKKNTVAVVTDGTAVLGLGDIGPAAAMPVMEGKALLFKEFAGVDAFPICLDVTDPQEIIDTVIRLAPTFGGINLEDIKAPICFEVEKQLHDALDIPIMHDDQHGTAVVALAGLINALKVTGRTAKDTRTVMLGAGASSIAVAKLFRLYGVEEIAMLDSKGLLCDDRDDLNPYKQEVASWSAFKKHPDGSIPQISEVIKGADLFIGLSGPGLVTQEDIASMNKDSMVFPMANPMPEVMPDLAKAAGAAIIATGRSDFPNQINNALGFPGIFRGLLDGRIEKVEDNHKLAAAAAIAGFVKNPTADEIVPSIFAPGLADAVAEAVKSA